MDNSLPAARQIDITTLRRFAVVVATAIASLFGLVVPFLLDRPFPIWPWIIAALLMFLALTVPQSLRPVYQRWMQLGLILHKFTTPLIMGILFYVVITPMGIVMRIFGYDPISRHYDPNVHTFRVVSKKSSKDSLERPF